MTKHTTVAKANGSTGEKENNVPVVHNAKELDKMKEEKVSRFRVEDASLWSKLSFKKHENLERVNVAFNEGQRIDIPDSMFEGCTNLEALEFGTNVKVGKIGKKAFSGCEKLLFVSVDLNAGEYVHTIGDGAFEGCKHLLQIPRIDLSKNEIRIGARAFKSCLKLLVVDMCGDNPQRPKLNLGREVFSECESLTYVCFRNLEIKKIPDMAFFNCGRLETLRIEDSTLCEVGMEAFKNCELLKNVELKLTEKDISRVCIENKAFSTCKKLESVNVSVQNSQTYGQKHIIKIGESAFEKCVLLKEFTLDIVCQPTDFETIVFMPSAFNSESRSPFSRIGCNFISSEAEDILPSGVQIYFCSHSLFDHKDALCMGGKLFDLFNGATSDPDYQIEEIKKYDNFIFWNNAFVASIPGVGGGRQ